MKGLNFVRKFRARDPFSPIESKDDLRQVGRMGPLLLFSAGFRFLFYVGCSYLLTRMIDPSDFGRLLQVGVPLALVGLFGDLGLGDGVIRLKNLGPRLSSLFFYINISLSITAATVLVLIMPAFEIWFNGAELMDLGYVIGLSVVSGGMVGQHRALLRRQLRYKTIAGLEIVTAVTSNGTAVLLALSGVGVIAIPLGRMLANVTDFILMAAATGWFPGRSAAWREGRGVLGFGIKLAGSGVIHFFSIALASLMIGRIFPEETLGYLERAAALSKGIVSRIRDIISRLSFSLLSRSRHSGDDDFAALLKTFFLAACCVAVVPVAVAGALSYPLVPIFFGDEWREMGIYLGLEWWAMTMVFPVTFLLNGLLAAGRSGTLAKFNLVRLVFAVLILVVFVVAKKDIVDYLIAMAAFAILDSFVFTIITGRLLKLPMGSLLWPFALSMLAGIASAATVVFLASQLHVGLAAAAGVLLSSVGVFYLIWNRRTLLSLASEAGSQRVKIPSTEK